MGLAEVIEYWEASGQMDTIECEAMADSGRYQDIDPKAPNYWRALSWYAKAAREYRAARKGV